MAYPNICILRNDFEEESGDLMSSTVYGPYWDGPQAEAGMMRLAEHVLDEIAKECAELIDGNPAEIRARLAQDVTQVEKAWELDVDEETDLIGIRVKLEIMVMKYA